MNIPQYPENTDYFRFCNYCKSITKMAFTLDKETNKVVLSEPCNICEKGMWTDTHTEVEIDEFDLIDANNKRSFYERVTYIDIKEWVCKSSNCSNKKLIEARVTYCITKQSNNKKPSAYLEQEERFKMMYGLDDGQIPGIIPRYASI
jgi:hypothetical protein